MGAIGTIRFNRFCLPTFFVIRTRFDTLDFMEEKNRLTFEVNRDRNPDVEVELEDAFERLGIPLEAVALEE